VVRPASLEGKRILVVEDEVLVSMLLEDELRDAGATVLGPAPSVGDALRLAEAAAADGGLSAAVLDINLEGQHVWPVADRLAALGVPFLFATGYGENCDTGGHGAAPVLHKPFDVETLVAAVATLASVRGRRGVPVVTVRSAAQAEAALTAWALLPRGRPDPRGHACPAMAGDAQTAAERSLV
jgi:DNA-binding response OmpR family regulator